MKKITQHLKVVVLMGIISLGMICAQQASAAEKNVNVRCLKTNTGNYFPLVRVSMMVVPDGGSTFEILLKDGQGEANVSSISFEKHTVLIDLDKYKVPTDGGGTSVDSSKKNYMFTNVGKFFSLGKDKPMLQPIEGKNLFNVTDRDGAVLATDVESVFFYRTNEPESIVGIKPIIADEEKLVLQTPIGYQMEISGCGDAKTAVVYDMNGRTRTSAPVNAGCSTIVVEELPAGVYIVKVGKKSLKFVKK